MCWSEEKARASFRCSLEKRCAEAEGPEELDELSWKREEKKKRGMREEKSDEHPNEVLEQAPEYMSSVENDQEEQEPPAGTYSAEQDFNLPADEQVPAPMSPAESDQESQRVQHVLLFPPPQKLLDENDQLVRCITEYLQKGRATECVQYQQILHRNIVYLGTIADAGAEIVPEETQTSANDSGTEADLGGGEEDERGDVWYFPCFRVSVAEAAAWASAGGAGAQLAGARSCPPAGAGAGSGAASEAAEEDGSSQTFGAFPPSGTVRLLKCGLTEESCSALATVLRSNSSLKELDISNNNLQDSGVKKLQNGLENTNCTLEKLRLSDCSITEGGYKALASALRSNPSHLIELDLRGNDPGQSGVKELSDLLQDPSCSLKTLKFLSPAADEACQYVRGIVHKNPLLQSELNLSGRELRDTRVNQIAALLQDKHCKLNTLMLNNNSITAEGCAALTSAFNSNPSNLIELDLSDNKLGNSGIKKICVLLANTQCKMEKLKLSDCIITEGGYKALASTLRSNPSHLIELDLRGNDPGQSGVKELSDLLQDERCTLKTIRFLKSADAQEACDYLTKVLGESPLIMIELDLSEDKLEDLDGEKLSALLMDSHSKVEKIKLNNCELTEKSCSVLATVLSKTILKELNLNNSRLLDSGVKEICEGLKKPVCELEIVKLSKCDLTEESCSALASVLSSDSNLKDLDLSNNNLQDSGVKLLSDGLKENCKLERLRLSDCSITEEGYKALASALRSNPSHLTELDLRGNYPGQSGVKELDELLQDDSFKLKHIRFLKSVAAQEACEYLTKVLGKSPLLQTELDLSEDKLEDLDGEKLSALLMDSHSKVEKIRLNNGKLKRKSYSVLATVLSKTILKELDLNNSRLLDSGVKEICEGLKNPVCELKILKLSDCHITEEGYKALASALRSNPSHLIELDLRGNDPGQSGVKELDDLLQDERCTLKTIRFLKSAAAQEACDYLTKVLCKSPLLQTELDLSEDKLGDLDGEKLSALLMDSHSKVEKIKLNNCDLTEKSCSVLATVLSSKTILKELNLNNSRLLDSGVKEICKGLKKPVCELKILNLCGCSITEKQCYTLTSALLPNLSHLRELDLSGNTLKKSGEKHLSGVLRDSRCKLERLRLRGCDMTDEDCSAVTSALNSNPSHLRELDLSGNKLGDTGVKNLSDLLKNPQCKLENLQLCKCSIKEKQCKILASALNSNPSHLRELDLSENEPGDSGFKNLGDLLKNPQCKLENLQLCECSIKEKQCGFLTSALKSNPSHLRELNLSGNYLNHTRVKHFYELLKDSRCKLKRLRLRSCEITAEDCSDVILALNSNPSHLRELDLSGNELGGTGVDNLGVLLSSSQCKLENLHLCGCSITEKECHLLTQSMCLNLSHLRELDFSGNQIGNKGLEILCDLLKHSQCKLEILSLVEEEGMVTKFFKGIGGWLGLSKPADEPVKSTAQEKPPSDEGSSEGKMEEESQPDLSSVEDKPEYGSSV
ncbi:unnamed protein product [Leuciscus chuanchicus]